MEPDDTKAKYKEILAELEQKKMVLENAIAGIKILLGDSNVTITPNSAAAVVLTGAAPDLADPHAFFGMSIAKAVEKYLTITKKPTSAADLAVALANGGFPSQSDKFAGSITTALYRGSDTFVRVKRGLWGLKVWYPNYRAPD